MNRFFPIVFSALLVILFFWQFFFKGLLPIPADTIIGLYHPYRDLYAKNYPRGIPFKNPLITDPIRQQYPWRYLSTGLVKNGQIPLWNPYSFSGTPLLSNFQSAIFYPLNFIFFIMPFNIAWSTLIILEVFLGSIFMLLYLNNLRINKWSSVLGCLIFSFSGFSIAWFEWGTILHVALWLPLILLSIDKLFSKTKRIRFWLIVLTFSLVTSFFAGHLQTFFYAFILSFSYFLFRWFQNGRQKKLLITFLICLLIFALITIIQWLPTMEFINNSARSIDQSNWQKVGWFIPWQNLLQFLVPDFFGNPSTLNYWGVFNYGEFIGYVGILPLILALFSLFYRRDKDILFFGSLFFISLIFVLPTFFAKLPYILNIPLISTSQPTRLLFVTDFSLAVLSAFGFDFLLRGKKGIFYPILFFVVVYVGLWFFVLNSKGEGFLVSRQNLILPSVLLIFSIAIIYIFLRLLKTKYRLFMIYIILALVIFDLFRFAWKFTPFTKGEYLYPDTKTLSYLQNQNGQFRIMATDSRIFPPNFSNIYKIQSIEGYDPLYIQRYGELIAASDRNEPNISPPFGFDRIITPHNFDSKIIDLLGVKYVLSISDLSASKLVKVFNEGETKVYENKNAFSRAFFVEETISTQDKNNAIKLVFDKDLSKIAIAEDFKNSLWSKGKVSIDSYRENEIVIKTENKNDGFLVLTESFYPSWHAKIDGKDVKIIRTDFNFRGIVVPKGNHTIVFYITLF